MSEHKEQKMVAETDIKELLQYAVEKDASDIHLTDGLPPTIRIDGLLVPTTRCRHRRRTRPQSIPCHPRAYAGAAMSDRARRRLCR